MAVEYGRCGWTGLPPVGDDHRQGTVGVTAAPAQDRNGINLPTLQSGDRDGTRRFVRAHAAWMLAVARRILKDADLAQDAVQTGLVNIFKNLHSFDGRSSVRTWMYRIVVNEALQTVRKRQALAEEPIDDLMPVFDASGCREEQRWATIETPESLLQRAQTRARVAEGIARLPDAYRVVLVLRDIEELSTQEVATLLDLSEANVRIRLHRARAALKKRLEPVLRGELS